MFVRVAVQYIRSKAGAIVGVCVSGHLGVGDETGGIEHPLMIISRTKSFVGDPEIDTLNFEGSESWLFVDGMAGDAGITSHTNELLANFNLVGCGLLPGWF